MKLAICLISALLCITTVAGGNKSYQECSKEEIHNDSTITKVLEYGVDYIFEKAADKYHVSKNNVDITKVNSVSKKESNGKTTYKCDVDATNNAGATVEATFTIECNHKTGKKTVRKWHYDINYKNNNDQTPVLENAKECSNQETILEYGVSFIFEKAADKYHVSSDNVDITKVNSVSKKESNGKITYKCDTDATNNDGATVKAIFTIECDCKTGKKIVRKWNYNINYKTNDDKTDDCQEEETQDDYSQPEVDTEVDVETETEEETQDDYSQPEVDTEVDVEVDVENDLEEEEAQDDYSQPEVNTEVDVEVDVETEVEEETQDDYSQPEVDTEVDVATDVEKDTQDDYSQSEVDVEVDVETDVEESPEKENCNESEVDVEVDVETPEPETQPEEVEEECQNESSSSQQCSDEAAILDHGVNFIFEKAAQKYHISNDDIDITKINSVSKQESSSKTTYLFDIHATNNDDATVEATFTIECDCQTGKNVVRKWNYHIQYKNKTEECADKTNGYSS